MFSLSIASAYNPKELERGEAMPYVRAMLTRILYRYDIGPDSLWIPFVIMAALLRTRGHEEDLDASTYLFKVSFEEADWKAHKDYCNFYCGVFSSTIAERY